MERRITEREWEVIVGYRKRPQYQAAVRLLLLDEQPGESEGVRPTFQVIRGNASAPLCGLPREANFRKLSLAEVEEVDKN